MTVFDLWCTFDNWDCETLVLIHHEGSEKPETYEEISYVIEKYRDDKIYLFWYFEEENKIALLLK